MSTEKKVKKPIYVDAEGNRRDPNRAGDPILCNAKKRRSDELCGNIARANGKCRNHGGNNTGPKTKAGRDRVAQAARVTHFKTGETVPIWFDMLNGAEQSLVESIPTDAEALLQQEIMLTTVRERRMLEHIKILQQWIDEGKQDISVQENWKRFIKRDKDGDELVFEREDGSMEKQSELIQTGALVIKDDPRKQLHAIEDALTRVQNHKMKLIELQWKLSQGNIEEQDGSLQQLNAILSKAREERLKRTQMQ